MPPGALPGWVSDEAAVRVARRKRARVAGLAVSPLSVSLRVPQEAGWSATT